MIQLDDYKIPGKNIKIQASLEIRTEDIAGETSGSDSVEKGFKPKMLRISLQLPFAKATDLTALVKTCEAVKNEERVIYTCTNKTANAMGIRQVRFVETLNVKENDSLRMWDISFALQEYMSNPERLENRSGEIDPESNAPQHKKVIEMVAKQQGTAS